MASEFEERYELAAHHAGAQAGNAPAPELRPRLHQLHDELTRRPPDLAALKAALVALFEFLASPEGRTDANCRTVDLFLSLAPYEQRPDLPLSVAELVHDTSMLHDTFEAPAVAHSFHATPEQLLERARRL